MSLVRQALRDQRVRRVFKALLVPAGLLALWGPLALLALLARQAESALLNPLVRLGPPAP